jgi:hypothetical protein
MDTRGKYATRGFHGVYFRLMIDTGSVDSCLLVMSGIIPFHACLGWKAEFMPASYRP